MTDVSSTYLFFAFLLLGIQYNLWVVKYLQNKIGTDDSIINKIISELYDLIVILGINKNTFSKAFLTARKLNITFYDSIYLSLSEDLDALLITADKKLYEAVKDKNRKVIMLSDFLL